MKVFLYQSGSGRTVQNRLHVPSDDPSSDSAALCGADAAPMSKHDRHIEVDAEEFLSGNVKRWGEVACKRCIAKLITGSKHDRH